MGLGFIWIALAPNLNWIMVAAAVASFSGTMNEVTFFDLVQARFPLSEVTKIVRLRMATDTAATLFLLLISPALFRLFSTRQVIAMAGGIWIFMGFLGLLSSASSKAGPA